MIDNGISYRARLSAEAYVNQLINEGRLSESKRQTEIDSIVEQKLSIIGLNAAKNRRFVSSRSLSFARA